MALWKEVILWSQPDLKPGSADLKPGSAATKVFGWDQVSELCLTESPFP